MLFVECVFFFTAELVLLPEEMRSSLESLVFEGVLFTGTQSSFARGDIPCNELAFVMSSQKKV